MSVEGDQIGCEEGTVLCGLQLPLGLFSFYFETESCFECSLECASVS